MKWKVETLLDETSSKAQRKPVGWFSHLPHIWDTVRSLFYEIPVWLEASAVKKCDFRWVSGHDLAVGARSRGAVGQSWPVTHWCMSSSFAPSSPQRWEAGVLISATWSVSRMDKNSLGDWAGSGTRPTLLWKLNWLWKAPATFLTAANEPKSFPRSNISKIWLFQFSTSKSGRGVLSWHVY